PELTLAKVYEFATTTPIDDLRFILKTKELNKAVSDASLKGDYGHALGRTIRESLGKHNIFGDTTHMHIMSATAAACDARMAGAPIPVMSNSGSGNQGISATMPVVVYTEDNNVPEEMLIRALALSHLTVIYIKQSLGRLSALCGCVVAATGSACGLTYMMGGGYEQVTYAVKNMVASLTGMLCDGAKPSCALKVASGASTAVMCAILAVDNRSVTEVEGIIDRSVDKSIKNMTAIGRDGMAETDKLVLDIMTNK
ncbi:MAG: serine dehydratase subunit alpha family protein, partial [bacterium]|nr:serine dehydratase subunit alpha family protein [Candidatus Aphodosoma intestinipullorum]